MMIAALALQLHGARRGENAAVAKEHIPRQIMEQSRAAPLGFQAQDKARISVDIDGFDGVHLAGNRKAHAAGSVMFRQVREWVLMLSLAMDEALCSKSA